MHVLSLVPIGASLVELRRPGGQIYSAMTGISLWMLVGVVWLARLTGRRSVASYYQRPAATIRGHWSRWTVAPALFIAWIFIFSDASWPQRLAFRISKQSLEQRVRLVEEFGAQAGVGRAGLLNVRLVQFIHEGVRFYTGPGYDGVPCGYAYCPGGRPPDSSMNFYWPYDGPWYEFSGNDLRSRTVTLIRPSTQPGPTTVPARSP
jgi:hypothetical protein